MARAEDQLPVEGSSAGVKQVVNGVVDFGGGDFGMTPDEIDQAKHGALTCDYTIAIVTHSLPQARGMSDYAMFLNTEETESGELIGYSVEMGETEALFASPQHEVTKALVTGRFG